MGSDSANMKQSGQFVLILAIFGLVSGQNQDNCHTYAAGVCRDSTYLWSSQGSSCNAVYGNIAGNKHNLGKLMTDNLKQSFQFIAMSSYFKSDIVNRMGMGKAMLEQSDKMWDRAQKVMHFMLHRGSVTSDMSPAFKLTNVNPFDINGEIKAMAHTLTTLKTNVEVIFAVHKHANNKHDHPDDPNLNSYDPSVIHFLEEELMEDYHKDVRLISGQLNVLGKMAKHQNSRNMGLHLFDKNL